MLLPYGISISGGSLPCGTGFELLFPATQGKQYSPLEVSAMTV